MRQSSHFVQVGPGPIGRQIIHLACERRGARGYRNGRAVITFEPEV